MLATSRPVRYDASLLDLSASLSLPLYIYLPLAFATRSLARYMMWRSIQYFFGGAISVLTTRSLLTSLGVSTHVGETSAAINWVIKDGAGRMGRFMFARIGGRSLDDKAKQWRLLGDGLMFMGAVGELTTSLVPSMFLPLACGANVAKNMAVVAASATRAPIYRTFALQNNLADITAKGESIANLSDVIGTAFGILLTKSKNVSTLPAFAVLSIGYLIASRREVSSVELPYFNTSRLGLAVDEYLATGNVPIIRDVNAHEPMIPWNPKYLRTTRVILGASVAEACDNAEDLQRALANTPGSSNSVLMYGNASRKSKKNRKVYVLFKSRADCSRSRTQAAYEGCFAALVLQTILLDEGVSFPPGSRVRKLWERTNAKIKHSKRSKIPEGMIYDLEFERRAARFVALHCHELFQDFDRKARSVGWKTHLNTLNTKDARLIL